MRFSMDPDVIGGSLCCSPVTYTTINLMLLFISFESSHSNSRLCSILSIDFLHSACTSIVDT